MTGFAQDRMGDWLRISFEYLNCKPRKGKLLKTYFQVSSLVLLQFISSRWLFCTSTPQLLLLLYTSQNLSNLQNIEVDFNCVKTQMFWLKKCSKFWGVKNFGSKNFGSKNFAFKNVVSKIILTPNMCSLKIGWIKKSVSVQTNVG